MTTPRIKTHYSRDRKRWRATDLPIIGFKCTVYVRTDGNARVVATTTMREWLARNEVTIKNIRLR
jgi:hypothetical protein